MLDLKAHKTRASGKTVQIQSELERLKSSGKNKLAAYGPDICNVVNEINKNARRFKAKPIGPLGMFVKIRENTPEDIIRALDHEMAPILSVFLVSCSQDQKELFNIFQRLRVSRKRDSNGIFRDLFDFLDEKTITLFHKWGSCMIPSLHKNHLDPIVISEQETFDLHLPVHKSEAQH